MAVVSQPLQKIPARDVIFRDLAPADRAWVPLGAAWMPGAVTDPVAAQFIDSWPKAVPTGPEESPALERSFKIDSRGLVYQLDLIAGLICD